MRQAKATTGAAFQPRSSGGQPDAAVPRLLKLIGIVVAIAITCSLRIPGSAASEHGPSHQAAEHLENTSHSTVVLAAAEEKRWSRRRSRRPHHGTEAML